MDQPVKEVMKPNPTSMHGDATLASAARTMRDLDIGSVVVVNDGRPTGIVTDRDIVIRGLAKGLSPDSALAQIGSTELTTISEDAPVEQAVRLMRDKKLRRLPVTRGETLVGILSIGDLAVQREPGSLLGDISSAAPNR
jgi:CBS domain-containing protein